MIDILHYNSRLYIFNTVENITFSPISKYWDMNDNILLTDYFKSVTNQLFDGTGDVHLNFVRYFRNYTNISKIHMYLYPIAVAEEYYGSSVKETLEQAEKVKDLLATTIRKNRFFIIDKMNVKIGSVLKDYDRKHIRVVYHLNDKNFFEFHDRKNDTIYVYDISRPDPIIKRKV